VAKVRATLPKGTPIEVWFQDEARVGQKNTITRRWARRGTRPSAPKDQRTKSACIFGAICPEQGKPVLSLSKGAPGWSCPSAIPKRCRCTWPRSHRAEIALAVAPGAHAVVLMDQAGWHMTGKLDVPANISIIALPAKCPELNPVENIWQFMRDNWLSNRVFTSYDNIIDHCCQAWNRLVDQPWRIMTTGRRTWAHEF
jgi:DDE superfamily endonuclease